MIRGRVNPEFKPIVNIQLLHENGEFSPFEVKFDTGFNGELGLLTSVIEILKNSPSESRVVTFANGAVATVNAYDVDAMIDGEVRRLNAMDFGSGSLLLGMKALPTWTGCVEFKINGDVTIEKMPSHYPLSRSAGEG